VKVFYAYNLLLTRHTFLVPVSNIYLILEVTSVQKSRLICPPPYIYSQNLRQNYGKFTAAYIQSSKPIFDMSSIVLVS